MLTAHHHPHLRHPWRGPHSEPWLSSRQAAGDMGSQAGGASVSSHHPGLHAALTSLPSSLGGGVRQHTWLWCSVAKPRPLDEKHLCRESDPVLTSGPCDRQGQTGTPRRPFSCRGEHGVGSLHLSLDTEPPRAPCCNQRELKNTQASDPRLLMTSHPADSLSPCDSGLRPETGWLWFHCLSPSSAPAQHAGCPRAGQRPKARTSAPLLSEALV